MAIAKRMAEDGCNVLAEDALALLENTLLAEPLSANGRDVRNLLEGAMKKRATRVVAASHGGGEVLTVPRRDFLSTVTKADFQ